MVHPLTHSISETLRLTIHRGDLTFTFTKIIFYSNMSFCISFLNLKRYVAAMSAVERSGDAFKILEQKSKPYEAKNDNTDEKNTVVINHV